MFISTQITSRLCPSHHILVIQWNFTLHNFKQQRYSFLNYWCIKMLIIYRRKFTLIWRKPVLAKALLKYNLLPVCSACLQILGISTAIGPELCYSWYFKISSGGSTRKSFSPRPPNRNQFFCFYTHFNQKAPTSQLGIPATRTGNHLKGKSCIHPWFGLAIY